MNPATPQLPASSASSAALTAANEHVSSCSPVVRAPSPTMDEPCVENMTAFWEEQAASADDTNKSEDLCWEAWSVEPSFEWVTKPARVATDEKVTDAVEWPTPAFTAAVAAFEATPKPSGSSSASAGSSSCTCPFQWACDCPRSEPDATNDVTAAGHSAAVQRLLQWWPTRSRATTGRGKFADRVLQVVIDHLQTAGDQEAFADLNVLLGSLTVTALISMSRAQNDANLADLAVEQLRNVREGAQGKPMELPDMTSTTTQSQQTLAEVIGTIKRQLCQHSDFFPVPCDSNVSSATTATTAKAVGESAPTKHTEPVVAAPPPPAAMARLPVPRPKVKVDIHQLTRAEHVALLRAQNLQLPKRAQQSTHYVPNSNSIGAATGDLDEEDTTHDPAYVQTNDYVPPADDLVGAGRCAMWSRKTNAADVCESGNAAKPTTTLSPRLSPVPLKRS